MIVTVLEQKYNCGCGKGISKETTPDLLDKLNQTISWDKVNWPKKKEGEETVPDTECLGIPPKFNPGDMFLWEDSIMAIDDPNSVVLVISETGPKSASRFIQYLDDEYNYNSKQKEIGLDLEIKELTWCDLDLLNENLEEYKIRYSKYKPISDQCDDKDSLKKRKLTIKGDSIPDYVTVYLNRQSIFYNPKEISPSDIEDIYIKICNWVIKNKKNKED